MYNILTLLILQNSDLPALTEEETIKILEKIYTGLREKVPNFIQMANGIKQQYAAQGQEISDMQVLQMHVVPVVESQLAEIQKAVANEYNFDDDELEEAVKFYTVEGNGEVEKWSNEIKGLYVRLGGKDEDAKEEEAEEVEVISKSQVVELLKVLAKKMTSFSDIYCKQYIEANGVPSAMHEMQKFQEGLMVTAQKWEELSNVWLFTFIIVHFLFCVYYSAENDMLGEFNISSAVFQATLMEHQADPAIGLVFHKMQVCSYYVIFSGVWQQWCVIMHCRTDWQHADSGKARHWYGEDAVAEGGLDDCTVPPIASLCLEEGGGAVRSCGVRTCPHLSVAVVNGG